MVRKEKIKTSTEFYYYLFLSIRNYLENISGGSTFKELSKNLLENLTVPLPSYEEQDKIAKILLDIDRRISLSKARKHRYEKIKQGLMDDLLTGRKRVKI
ncbi:MAG TPA: restriction endonuclease subunit S [Ignavibacteria bacterium]|nr:restriction endonuclease subunit S [Ignavibacteria bacterium]